MGTISDKLIRIINTKEDIRQALISKGYDVPTSIPFKEYAKMILDLPCNADSFPDIEGIVARYSASGITNEQMAANPVWVDKTGNGHDIQLKNFSWKGMSGVGGYGDENYQTFYKFTLDDYVFIATPSGVKHMNFTFRVTGLQPGNKLTLAFFGTTNTVYGTWDKDGIYTVNSAVVEVGKPVYFYNGYGATRGEFTIEILPLYPGALVFDGVDDYGVCDNFPILTKEKGYTVVALRQYLVDKSTAYLTANGDSISNTSFILEGNNYRDTWNFGKATTIQASRILATQTSKQYDGVKLNIGTNTEGSNLLQVGKWSKSYSNVAIWELVFLDHDATEEELTKIKDYFVKTYPWLFPDQAWTVVGKTNEDEDRATIANITGNGNDLVLSNFGFAKGSGYGLYNAAFSSKSNLQYWSKQKIQFSKSQIETNKVLPYLIMECKDELSYNIKIKMTGFDSGVKLKWGFTDGYTYIEGDGIHVLNKKSTTIRHLHIEYSEDFDPDHVVTIEQIPEYEGYLITDGVDDIASSNTVVYEADFTFIGEWKFIQKDDTVAGINSVSHLYIQNRYNRGATVMINSTFENKKNITDYMTFKAITSKGKGYDENWNEVDLLYGDGNKGPSQVSIGGQGGSDFCHMIFKNMALYMNKVFTKDECIKAYNYLQTLKSK